MRELTVLPVLKIQSVLLNHLNVALKFSSINVFVFFTMIHSIEAKVAAKLLNKGGIFKFIYQVIPPAHNAPISHSKATAPALTTAATKALGPIQSRPCVTHVLWCATGSFLPC